MATLPKVLFSIVVLPQHNCCVGWIRFKSVFQYAKKSFTSCAIRFAPFPDLVTKRWIIEKFIFIENWSYFPAVTCNIGIIHIQNHTKNKALMKKSLQINSLLFQIQFPGVYSKSLLLEAATCNGFLYCWCNISEMS